ncbi:unnamed protein product [Ectocarpus sp. CCAP 1310/34]|nr:unnamed protein product [Ectocarpus sp. CCAP 1310/34]
MFNTSMSSFVPRDRRVGVGKIVTLWPYVDYAKKQQVGLSACGLGKQYALLGFLTNWHSCFCGNSTSKYFGAPTPRLQSYLQGQG